MYFVQDGNQINAQQMHTLAKEIKSMLIFILITAFRQKYEFT